MKTPRGFAPLVLIIVIGLAVLGGAVYWAGTRPPSTPDYINETFFIIGGEVYLSTGGDVPLHIREADVRTFVSTGVDSAKDKNHTYGVSANGYLTIDGKATVSAESNAASTKTVEKINWNIEKANTNVVDENNYRKYEQAISVDVTLSDKSTSRYSLGTAYGCAGSTTESMQDGKRVLGRVNCYFALTGVAFTAYSKDGRFFVERFEDDASGRTNGKTIVVLEI